MCKAIQSHLTDFSCRWFQTLKPNFISSWKELKEAFSLQFVGVKKYVSPKQKMTMVYEKPNESLKEWLVRYGEVVTATIDMTDWEALMRALFSMKKSTTFKRDLNCKPSSTDKEFLVMAQGYIKSEEVDTNDPEHRLNKNKETEQGSTSGKQDSQKWRIVKNSEAMEMKTSRLRRCRTMWRQKS